MYTSKKSRMNNCLLFSQSCLKRLILVPNRYDYRQSAESFLHKIVAGKKWEGPYRPTECLSFLGWPEFHKYYNSTKRERECQCLDICIDPRKSDTLSVYDIDCMLEYECFNKLCGQHDMGKFQGNCVVTCPLNKDTFNKTGYLSKSIYSTMQLKQ